jgi:hypothetical protein
MFVPFGPWRPDKPDFKNPCITATNVYPWEGFYRNIPSITAFTDALPAMPIGVVSFRASSGAVETFAGTETELYRLNGATWVEVSQSTYSTSEFWRFAVYGNLVIATNGVDNPQKFDVTSDSAFSDLSNAPIHRFPIVIRDTLVALDVNDGSNFNVKWSAVNDPETWTAASGGGSQLLVDGGSVIGGVGGEFGVILQDEAVVRMDFVGGDLRFTFDKIEGGLGCLSRESIVNYKGMTYYISESGFQAFNGAESFNISDDAVSQTFFSDLLREESIIADDGELLVDESGEVIAAGVLGDIEGAVDLQNACIVWKYPSSAGGNRILFFNYREPAWSLCTEDIFLPIGYVEGGGVSLAGFNSEYKLCLFNGDQTTSTVSTGYLSLGNGSGMIQSVRPVIDSSSTVTIGKKTDLADTETTNSSNTNSNGKASIRSRGRMQRIQVVPTGDFTEISGVEVDVVRTGGRI